MEEFNIAAGGCLDHLPSTIAHPWVHLILDCSARCVLVMGPSSTDMPSTPFALAGGPTSEGAPSAFLEKVSV